MLHIYYRILSINKDEASLVVRYWSDSVSEEELMVNESSSRTDVSLNLWEPTAPAEKIHDFILSHAPAEWLELKRKVRDRIVDTSLSQIQDWVGKVRDGVPIPVGSAPLKKPIVSSEVDLTNLLTEEAE
jgi:hypothetical protein